MKPSTLPLALVLCLSAACQRRTEAPAPRRTDVPATTPDVPATTPAAPPAAPATATAPDDVPDAAPPPPPSRFGLSLGSRPLPPGEHDMPRQQLSLTLRLPTGTLETRDLGVIPGVCSAAATPDGALGAYRCWWAGAGTEFVVRRSGPELVATRIEVDEQSPRGAGREVARFVAPAGDIVTLNMP